MRIRLQEANGDAEERTHGCPSVASDLGGVFLARPFAVALTSPSPFTSALAFSLSNGTILLSPTPNAFATSAANLITSSWLNVNGLRSPVGRTSTHSRGF